MRSIEAVLVLMIGLSLYSVVYCYKLNKTPVNPKIPQSLKSIAIADVPEILLLSLAGSSLTVAAYSLFNDMRTSALASSTGYPVFGSEAIMSKKAHGTSASPVQSNLRYGVSVKLADEICNFNRRFAENAGYFQGLMTLRV